MSDVVNPMTGVLTYGEPLAVFKLYAAIGRAQAKFLDIPKNKEGQIGNQRFQYAPYHVIRKCILPALTEEGVAVMQPTHTEGNRVAVTLIVSGHDAAISSTITFEANQKSVDKFTKEVKFDVQMFGKDHTYWRRYQLQSFFCLEGDKDADDPDDSEEVVRRVEARVNRERDANSAPVPSSPRAERKPVAVSDSGAKPAEAEKEKSVADSVKSGDPRSVNEKLMDAKKQLNWEMKDFDAFAKEHPDDFPGFVSSMKMSNDHKQRMWELLLQEKGIAPF